MKNNNIKTFVAVGIGAALFFVLGRFVAIPSHGAEPAKTDPERLLSFLLLSIPAHLSGSLRSVCGEEVVILEHILRLLWPSL